MVIEKRSHTNLERLIVSALFNVLVRVMFRQYREIAFFRSRATQIALVFVL